MLHLLTRLRGTFHAVLAAFWAGTATLLGFTVLDTAPPGLSGLPDHDYLPDVRALQAERRVVEAIQLARYAASQTNLPHRAELQTLATELEQEHQALRARALRATQGFLLGSGNSIEEVGGAIASDLVLYGDLRDLVTQGYYRVTGRDTDVFVAALAALGLVTELADGSDWAPALLKALRKSGRLSRRFTEWTVRACREAVSQHRAPERLTGMLRDLAGTADELGLARTAALMPRIDTPRELARLRRWAVHDADTAYLSLRHGGSAALDLADDATLARHLPLAARKGPDGIRWLLRAREGGHWMTGTRVASRTLKNLRLGRLETWVQTLSREHTGVRNVFLLLCAALLLPAGQQGWKARCCMKRAKTPPTDAP